MSWDPDQDDRPGHPRMAALLLVVGVVVLIVILSIISL
jgi:hypothetical protein